MAAEIRALVPLALEAVQSEHEADHSPSVAFEAITRGSILIGETLKRIGLSAKIAYQQAAVARRFVDEIALATKAGGKIADG